MLCSKTKWIQVRQIIFFFFVEGAPKAASNKNQSTGHRPMGRGGGDAPKPLMANPARPVISGRNAALLMGTRQDYSDHSPFQAGYNNAHQGHSHQGHVSAMQGHHDSGLQGHGGGLPGRSVLPGHGGGGGGFQGRIMQPHAPPLLPTPGSFGPAHQQHPVQMGASHGAHGHSPMMSPALGHGMPGSPYGNQQQRVFTEITLLYVCFNQPTLRLLKYPHRTLCSYDVLLCSAH